MCGICIYKNVKHFLDLPRVENFTLLTLGQSWKLSGVHGIVCSFNWTISACRILWFPVFLLQKGLFVVFDAALNYCKTVREQFGAPTKMSVQYIRTGMCMTVIEALN